ncbi:solute carrier family 23 protein [Desertibacillus haloalkaliphilus]|uniref:solute carrier family 23 protein n=1 Tax=Desertibacillus haloalkaliphilus TaxID=1328930 RepID=UPI001C265005|nr:solute carrier family 23 protein [Desertibacillus haloalkaliphilus]MBU8908302.1 xanthine/uracil/vitamin C permease [Desertibacillus haloalkaliphilus]
MAFYKRKDGEEHPHWPLGPFQIRLPFIHYRLETPEIIQGIVLFAIGLTVIPLLENYVGFSYEAALAVATIYLLTMLIPPLMGVPFVPGFITAAIPLVIIFLGNFEPGPEAVRALIGLQLSVAVIFLLLGITGLGKMIVTKLPNSLKSGILIGAGIAAILGEIEAGGRLATTPISLIIGTLVCFYLMFSNSFQQLYNKGRIAKVIANFGIMPAIIVAIIIGWASREYQTPTIEWGFVIPNFPELWNYTPFVVGLPDLNIILLAIPTALIAYIIAYGDIVVGTSLLDRASEKRNDEKVPVSISNLHTLTFFRNFVHALFAPHPGLAGPIFTAGTASVMERYKYGRKAMDSIHSGTNSLLIAMFISTITLPLVTLFQPVLPIALSLTLILTGYLCISIGIDQVKTPAERGVAGVMAIVLFAYGAAHALIVGLILYFLIQKKSNDKQEDQSFDENIEKTG